MPVVYQKDEKQSILRKAQQSLVSKERGTQRGWGWEWEKAQEMSSVSNVTL